jgi:demethylmenaquinone methyltransferase / 2-methoxy-6-polyprenyl-1,4-benzoquinol methylase
MSQAVVGTEVRRMFGTIAERYDLTNSVLSGGIHHLWKRKTAARVPRGARVLDLCTGTGDLLPLLVRRCREVVGGDFCEPMLRVARSRFPGIELVECDALDLPFEDGRFDAITVAFGVRNLEDLGKGLREMHRVLSADGRLVVLEFGQPKLPVWRSIYSAYSKWVMPLLGGLLTGNRSAYEYLPETAKRFPCGERFREELLRAGFRDVRLTSLTGGIAYLYEATR